MQFGHWPEQQRSPRGRWYLKEREKIRWPAANKAEPRVSPANASTRSPSNEKETGAPRSIRSAGCGGSLVTRGSIARAGGGAKGDCRTEVPSRYVPFLHVPPSAGAAG